MGLEKEGMCLYIKARDELAGEAQKLLADTAARELLGEEGEMHKRPSGTGRRQQRRGWG